MSRWKASLIHLTISAIIATAVLALMLLLWYPYPLFAAVGGQQVLMILLGVDVTLGPLITLTVFNINKSRRALTFDLSVIALLQVAALIYGMSVVFHARPAFMVFSKDSFDLVTANMLSDADLAKAGYPDYRSLPLTGPVYVYSEMPTGIKEGNEVVLSTFSGKDLPQFPQYYQPFAEHMAAAGQAAKPMAELRKKNPEHGFQIDEAIHTSGRAEAEIGYLPLRAKHEDQVVLVGKNDGKVLNILRIPPW
ncbi:MAG: TfpX/TfpZ family type IV pilin accessory protein [Gallionella sp.]